MRIGCTRHCSRETMRASGSTPLRRLPGRAARARRSATVNLISLFGLHRRWRGALVGHLALFEMSSVVPMGALRGGAAPARARASGARVLRRARRRRRRATRSIALHDLAGSARGRRARAVRRTSCSALAPLLDVEGVFAQHLLRSWVEGRRSSLRQPRSRRRPDGAMPLPTCCRLAAMGRTASDEELARLSGAGSRRRCRRARRRRAPTGSRSRTSRRCVGGRCARPAPDRRSPVHRQGRQRLTGVARARHERS